jgi:peptide/nickel transport system substrate-binding protein
MRRLVPIVALAAALAAGCGGEESGEPVAPEPTPPAAAEATATTGTTGAEPPETTGAEASRGGTFRIGVESSFSFTGGLDPTGEYLLTGFAIHLNLLLRPLYNYPHIAGPPGNELMPDLAAGLPQVSPDGLTYTVRLKPGVRFGPPVSREITSADVAYAFERIGTPQLVAQYGFYYDPIVGMDEFEAGEASSIAGIQTPDDRTIVFTLERPAGDFPYLLAMPATAPIPEEIAGCFGAAGEYGRYVIASGPYMIEGSEGLATACESMEPLPGFDPDTHLHLVRNPDYDPATDDPRMREALPDRFEFTINSSAEDIYAKLERGELEAELASPLPDVIRRYTGSEELSDRLRVDPSDVVLYLSMNLTQPPFDDVHVRRAVNLVLDKDAMRRATGGEHIGEVATHVVPDTVLGGVLGGYDPYPSPGQAGDVEAAREAMRLSRYDTDGDGLCDAGACRDVVHVTLAVDQYRNQVPVIEASLAAIGIELVTREHDDAFSIVGDVSRNIPLHSVGGWGKDRPDAGIYLSLFDSRTIIPLGNFNHPLVGLTPEQAESLEGITGTTAGIPSIDADIDRCAVLVGPERVECWAALDRRVMEEIAPIVPYQWTNEVSVLGSAVAQWEFDQALGTPGWAHVAVDAAQQRGL